MKLKERNYEGNDDELRRNNNSEQRNLLRGENDGRGDRGYGNQTGSRKVLRETSIPMGQRNMRDEGTEGNERLEDMVG